MVSRGIASRIEIPLHLIVRRRIQQFIDRRIRFCETKAIQEANCGGPKESQKKSEKE